MTTVTEPATPRVRGRLGDEHGSLPLVAVQIDGDICDLVATTVVRQTFRNTRSTPIEATYVFPLPDRAGVTSFVADLAGRVVEGRLSERGQAREEYDKAIASGHRAAIAEEDRPGVFTMRVGNLQPGEDAAITLTLTGPLPVEDQVAEYRFPLVVAPRYVAGTPIAGPTVGDGVAWDTDRVPDASRVTPPVLLPGQESPVQLDLRATVRVPGLRASQVSSTLHVAHVADADGVVTVALQPGERLDSDVVLRWPVATEDVRTSAVVVPDEDGGEGATWQISVVPQTESTSRRPRDVVVVLDRSGSMDGWKMVAARRAAARVVDSLGIADRFAVLAFDNELVQPPGEPGLRPGTDRDRWAAVSWLAELSARGGTEMVEPLREAARLSMADEDQGRDRYIVLVTDGQVAGEDDVLRAFARTAGAVRLFALGIDKAVNAGFLRRLAAAGAGRCDLVESEDRLDDALVALHRRICPPVATGLTVTADGVQLRPDETAPSRPADLFAGVPLTLSGRVSAMSKEAARFTVRGDGLDETVVATTGHNAAVRTVWARARVRELEDTYAVRRGDDALADQIVATSLHHGVLSRFTAFVAVDRDRTTAGGEQQLVVQPVELPHGWAAQPTGAPLMAMAPSAPGAAARGAGAAVARSAGADRLLSSGRKPELDAYRRRVDELLERVVDGELDAGVLAELDELVADLESVGAPEDWLAVLRRLTQTIRARGDVAAAVAEVREELARSSRSRKSRRKPFWRA